VSNSAVLQIKGMHCASCVSRVEKAIAGVPGVSSAAVNLASASAHIAFKGRSQSKEVAQAVENAGFTVTAPTLANPFQDDADSYKRAAIFAGFLALPVFVLEMGSHLIPGMHHWIAGTIGLGTSAWIQMILTALILIGPGRTFFTIGIRALMRRAPEMNALVALGSGAAFLFSTCVVLAPGLLPETARAIYFESAAIIVVFILIGRWLEARAKGQAGDAVRAMLALRPDSATVLRDGKEKTIAVVNLKIGDEILARPGERIATDGVILSGQSPVDEAMISGEPMPIDKAPGDTLIGGTMNGACAITYRATAVGEDTYLAGMARLVDHAQSQKLPIQHVLEKVTRVFVPVVICVAVLACTVWLLAGASLSQALVVLVSVLIIACPCAMGLATPASIMVGTGRAAERGILFRRSEALQVLKDVSIFAFDKTGTLTKGEMTVSEVQGGDEVLRLAAAVEALSEHPIAQAIVAASAGMKVPTATGFVAEPGQGATAFVDGSEIRVGNAAFVGADAVTSPSTPAMRNRRPRLLRGRLGSTRSMPVFCHRKRLQLSKTCKATVKPPLSGTGSMMRLLWRNQMSELPWARALISRLKQRMWS